MKKFPKDTKWLLYVGTLSAIIFFTIPVMAAKMTPEDKLRKAEELSIKASEMAIGAKESYDIGLAKKALELADQATYLVLEASNEAGKKADPALIQAAINTATSVKNSIAKIIDAATFISRISADPKTIADAKEILEKANKAEELNNQVIQIVRSFVAEPSEKVVSEKRATKVESPDTEATEQEKYQQEISPSQ
jgi:hypothetical protein